MGGMHSELAGTPTWRRHAPTPRLMCPFSPSTTVLDKSRQEGLFICTWERTETERADKTDRKHHTVMASAANERASATTSRLSSRKPVPCTTVVSSMRRATKAAIILSISDYTQATP